MGATRKLFAGHVFQWAFSQSEQHFLFPDEHLGPNTGVEKGIPTEQMVVWDPFLPLGGTPRRHYSRQS